MQDFFKEKKNKLIIVSGVVFFILGVFISPYVNPFLSNGRYVLTNDTPSTEADLSSFWKVWNALDEKHPDASNTNATERMYGAISGLVNSLNDPYTVFFNPEDTKAFEEDISGNFSGIGMEVDIKDNILTVIAPLKNTPAYKAGIKSGDKILKIEETLTSELTIDKAVKMIRGEKGTSVKLTIYSEGDSESREISVIRDIINIPTLDTELRTDGIFVIKLYSFSANSANLFRGAIKEFYESKSDRLLLDLRGNPGGYLDASVDMASWFLENGKPIVIEDGGTKHKQMIYRSAGYNIFNDNLKFAILIDGGSASASEILAGAMQDYNRAILIGSQSYGKGSVQEVVEVTPDTILKVTVAKWFTPNGQSISEKGLTPDYEVKYTKEDRDAKRDPQTEKAISLLNNWPK